MAIGDLIQMAFTFLAASVTIYGVGYGAGYLWALFTGLSGITD